MTKYDWSRIPSWVNWVFVDQDGCMFGCDNKPCDKDGFHGDMVKDRWDYLGDFNSENWQESLEERPK